MKKLFALTLIITTLFCGCDNENSNKNHNVSSANSTKKIPLLK